MAKIINITEAVAIALHSAILITNNNCKPVNVNYIAEATGSSKFHIAKVLQKLVRDGLLGSHRGPNGGFYLVSKPENITLLQIFESIEGKIKVSHCPIHKETCPFSSCVFGDQIAEMTENFKNYLESNTLYDYINNSNN
jgi:Rrf2 family protein